MRLKRHRILIGIGGILMIVAISYGLALRSGNRPAIVSVTVAKYEVAGDLLSITVNATNIGPTPLISFGNPPFSAVRFQTRTGSTNLSPKYVSQRSSFRFLLPGRCQSYQFTVPRLATRFQVGCYFETAGARTSLTGHLIESGRWNRLAPELHFLLRWVPDGTGKNIEFWSQEIEVAERN